MGEPPAPQEWGREGDRCTSPVCRTPNCARARRSTHHPPGPRWDVVAQLPFDGSVLSCHVAARELHLRRARRSDTDGEKFHTETPRAPRHAEWWEKAKKLTMNQSPAELVARWAAVICCEEDTPPHARVCASATSLFFPRAASALLPPRA